MRPRKNKDGKWTRFFIARPAATATKIDLQEVDPYAPETGELLAGVRAAGKVRVENDDQVWTIISVDDATQEIVERTFRDVTAIAQEHLIPHKPYDPDAN